MEKKSKKISPTLLQ